MSVSSELLCSFELLKPLDSTALKNHIKKGRNKRNSMLNSPVRRPLPLFLVSLLRVKWSSLCRTTFTRISSTSVFVHCPLTDIFYLRF